MLILSFRLEQKTVERKRISANLKVLEHVLEQVSKEIFEEVVYITQSTIFGQSSSVGWHYIIIKLCATTAEAW